VTESLLCIWQQSYWPGQLENGEGQENELLFVVKKTNVSFELWLLLEKKEMLLYTIHI